MKKFRISGVFLSVLFVLSFLILGFSFSEQKISSSKLPKTYAWDRDVLPERPGVGNKYVSSANPHCAPEKATEIFKDYCIGTVTLVELFVGAGPGTGKVLRYCVEDVGPGILGVNSEKHDCSKRCENDNRGGVGNCVKNTAVSPAGHVETDVGHCLCQNDSFFDWDNGNKPGTASCIDVYFEPQCKGSNLILLPDFCGKDGSLYEHVVVDSNKAIGQCGVNYQVKKHNCDSWCEAQDGTDYGICSTDEDALCSLSWYDYPAFCECFVE